MREVELETIQVQRRYYRGQEAFLVVDEETGEVFNNGHGTTGERNNTVIVPANALRRDGTTMRVKLYVGT
ncbi:MAG: hypothetical protein GY851_22680, partial [bacterium]|nr:hypothetical protein [bacterium]